MPNAGSWRLARAFVALALVTACSVPPRRTGGPLPDDVAARASSPSERRRTEEAERRIPPLVDAARIEATLRTLGATTRRAGSAAALASAHDVADRFREAGLDVRLDTYDVLLPLPDEISVELVRPAARAVLRLDTAPREDGSIPGHFLFSPDGTASGAVVYAGRGRARDYEALRAAGVDLRRAIGVAVGGERAPSVLARDAADAGLAAILVIEDPASAHPGSPAPAGLRSALDLGTVSGDPLTPGIAAVPDAARRPLSDPLGVPAILSVQIDAEAARSLVGGLDGPALPEALRRDGAPERAGGTRRTIAKVVVRTRWTIAPIVNVVARLDGALSRDDEILVLAPRDAAGIGAVESVSGTAVLLEVARSLADYARTGAPPARSLVFCSVDGRAFGNFGAAEHADALGPSAASRTSLVLDLANAVRTGRLVVEATPGEVPLVRSVGSSLPDPADPGSLLFDDATIAVAFPGAGSGAAPFFHRFGIPVIGIHTDGELPAADEDTLDALLAGDPGLVGHRRVVIGAAALAWRAATSTLVASDPKASLVRARETVAARRPESVRGEAPLGAAFAAAEEAATILASSLAALLADDPSPVRLRDLDRGLVALSRVFLAPESAEEAAARHLLAAFDPEEPLRIREVPEVAPSAIGVGSEAPRTLGALRLFAVRARELASQADALAR